jgi:hypothetical protein
MKWSGSMSIENENNSIEIIIAPKANCVVSYSLNNEQPVRSTHIGNQPLFYMDFEENFEEEEGFMEAFAEELGEAGSEYFNVDAQLSKYDQIAKHFNKDVSWRESAMSENISDMLGNAPSADQHVLDLDSALELMKNSRVFTAQYDYALTKGVSLQTSTTIKTTEFVRDANVILVNASMSQDDAVLLIAREIRRFWQKDSGTSVNPLSFHPDQAIVINRAQIADLNVFMVRVAWELQLAGEKSTWAYIEHSSLSDIGRAYAREACGDFRTMNNGEAAQAAFEAWFLSERCRKTDKILIQQMLSEYNGYVFGEDSAASKTIAFELLSKLGEQSFGKNYLEPYANIILHDPVFTEVRDRSNANFLWFIKFERSFKEAEQELHSEGLETNSALQDSKNDQSEENVFFIADGTTEHDVSDEQSRVIQFKPR